MAGMLKRFCRGFLCILGICLTGGVGAPLPGEITPVKRIEILAEKDGVRIGESMRLAVRVSLAGEFHINSHVPSAEYLIPTTFELAVPEGLLSGDWEFPKGKTKKFSFSETPLSIYEGTFVIQGTVKATEHSQPGPRQARGVLKYQACTDQRCYPPKKQDVVLSMSVVPPGAPVHPLHPELFQPVVP
jgi:thioredoxin:protein disulfide reductase